MFLIGNLSAAQLWRLLLWWLIHKGPARDVTVDTFNGRLTFNSRNWLIGKYLYVKREHEEHEIREVIRLLESESLRSGTAAGTVMNVGANIGMTCIGLVQEGHFERAIAIEPIPENYRLLKKNIGQNNLAGRIDALEIALSSVDGELTMEISDDNAGDHRVRTTDKAGFYGEEKRSVISVAARTLDTLTEELKQKIDVIWIDIQGHEGHVFQGGKRFLSHSGIPVVSEFWPYGIDRSGIARPEYVAVLAEIFSHFWVVGRTDFRCVKIEEVGQLFEHYPGARNFCLLLLTPRLKP